MWLTCNTGVLSGSKIITFWFIDILKTLPGAKIPIRENERVSVLVRDSGVFQK